MADVKSTNLHTITKKLRSDKVKERQEGLSQLRACFDNERLISGIDEEGTGQAWLVIYQALFDVFDKEKVACTKKGSLTTATTGPGATALRRLSEVAGVVRYVIERSIQRLNGKVVRPLLAHLLSSIKYRGKLLAPVSLDYIKAITNIVSWRPHLEHIDEETWLTMVELGFNVLLDDPFKTRFEEEAGQEDGQEESPPPESAAGASGGSDYEEELTASPSKKRRYVEAKPTQKASTRPRNFIKPQDSPSITKEHIEFAHLLSILLESESAPILSPRFVFLPAALLDRLQRFLTRYPTDTSLHHHYLSCLSAVLSHLALNRVQLVADFSKKVWSSLVDMWGTKNQSLKEDLVVILRTLFPFLTIHNPSSTYVSSSPHLDGVTKLWRLLEGEAQSRWGVDGLPLDSLRLEIYSKDEEEDSLPAFVGQTFRYGWHFGPNEALTWAKLELQADCIEKLFSISESAHSMGKLDGKRVKLENPVASLLSSIRFQPDTNVRAYHLQTLLFFVDRHWGVLHEDLQLEITSTILQFLSFDEPLIQSWSFMCFAAITHAVGSAKVACSTNSPSQSSDSSIWDTIWTHAMRRSNVPAVCRAACHVARTMLHHAKALLSPQRVLAEVETLAKDLDVQGPSFPFDSVCGFLIQCIHVASQDVRLYRMQLEEKVLTWLVGAWRLNAVVKTKMPLHTVEDILLVLDKVCGTSKKAQLICKPPLPDCRIVDALTEECSSAIIRNFLLYARLPPFYRSSVDLKGHPNVNVHQPPLPSQFNLPSSAELAPPRGRERRISGFFLKSLEDLAQVWEAPSEALGPMTAERARSSLDFAIIALSFESILVLSNTRSNRRTIQAACKLLRVALPLVADSRWTISEKALIVSALDPLILPEPRQHIVKPWEGILPPVEESGIRREVLDGLASGSDTLRQQAKAARLELQRALFQSSDIQDAIAEVMKTLRNVLHATVGYTLSQDSDPDTMRIDDHDDFGPSRLSKDSSSPSGNEQTIARSGVLRHLVDVCVTSLSVFPVLQSSGEPTRDKQLTELVTDAAGDAFLLLAPAYLKNVGQRVLSVNLSAYENLLDRFELLLRSYNLSRSPEIQLLTIQLLHTTMHIWIQEASSQSVTGENIQGLCEWLANLLSSGKLPSWVARNLVVCFLDDYFLHDPEQAAWPRDPDADLRTPASILATLGGDPDIRVRFRVAAAGARLLHFAPKLGVEVSMLYNDIRQNLSNRIIEFESMLTRFICLGNIVVVNSAVRRGPYWHLLEAALYSNDYTRHIETVLKAVATRLGMTNYSELFELYASQIATSIRDSGQDFLRFPPHILGYKDRRESAAATFLALTPANVLASGTPASVAHGWKLFENHCKILQKTPAQGMRDCFSEVVGYQVVSFLDRHRDGPEDRIAVLEDLVKAKMEDLDDDYSFDQRLREHVDGIVTAIIRTMGDQDISPHGPIIAALTQEDADAVPVFLRLCAHRSQDIFEPHHPNLPAYPTSTVLKALGWFNRRVPYRDNPAITYHVLHRLFAELQRSPLVNEQLRLLNALSVWISCHYDHFQDLTVLRTLFNGAASLLTQYDLCRGAQSLLDWGLSLYQDGRKDPRLAEILLRVAYTGNDYSLNPAEDITRVGLDILSWLEQRASSLLQNRGLRPQVTIALSAWPRELPPELKALCPEPSSRELSSIISDESISSSKFRLVQRLRDLSSSGIYENEAFSKYDFWKLKDSIPPEERLLGDDIDAFASLLLLQKGNISGLGNDQTGLQTIRSRHIRVAHELNKTAISASEILLATNQAIVISLLATLHEATSSQVHLAFRTLRSLVSVSNLDTTSSRSLTSVHRAELEHLRAFPHSSEPSSVSELDLVTFLRIDPTPELFQDFSTWARQLATLLSGNLASKDRFYAHLAVILQEDPHFAEQTIPVLVLATLLVEHASGIPSDQTSLRTLISNYFMTLLSDELTAMHFRRVIVDTILHLRHFSPPGIQDPLAHDKWLNVDYVLLSKSAITCGAYTTALLFLELAEEYRGSTPCDSSTVEQIMYDIYNHIDEPDGFYGISTQDLRRFLLKRVQHEKQWDKAFQFYGAAMETRSTASDDAEGVLNALHSFGFHQLAMSTLQGSPGILEASNSSAMTYHLGWRTETWDLPEHTQDQNAGAPLYLALRAVHRERDREVMEGVVRNALLEEIGQLRVLGNENVACIRQVSRNLMCLSQVKQWLSPTTQQYIRTGTDIFTNWDELHGNMEFGDLECIMATRISLIGSARQKEEREQIGDLLTPTTRTLINAEAKCLLDLSEAARLAGQVQIALNSVVRAQKLKESSFDISQEYAQVLWLMKEPKLAVQYAQNLIRTLQSEQTNSSGSDYLRKAKLLTLLGTWTSEACLGNPVNIKTEFFDVAADLCEENVKESSEQMHASIFYAYAMFAERQYHAIARSPDMLRWRVYADRKAMEIESRERSMEANRSNQQELARLKHLNRAAETQMKDDLLNVATHIQTRDTFLRQAIEMHSRSLATSDAFDDDSPIRLTSLWFANFDSTENHLQQRIGRALGRIPSRKFVFLAHQLSARLHKPLDSSEGTTENQENLRKVVIRMCREHPFHSLFPVFCLRSMDAQHMSSSQLSTSSRRQSGVAKVSSSQDTRANAATDIFDRLRSDQLSGSRVTDMENVCIASLEFAKYPIKPNPPKPRETPQIPPHLLIRKIKNVRVPVITAHTALDPTQKYDDCVWISNFENTYRTAGGVNLPKIANCMGSDGKKYKQLFKGEGNDDLRQDAVMEQVFELVNMVLRRDRKTAKRDLKVRVYKVIPLSSQAGVLEFVGNTIPVMSYVQSAHMRYQTNDISVKEFQKQMIDCGKPYRDPKRLTALFIKLRERFKPVMRHFFTEYHKTPTSWFKMRLNYARSVAATSIVGHILGLGDRHCSNILIDISRGDVIHIDLGIAFEQGKLLPIPERVPFRLTADIVDGLGTTGTQGVFQRCAEETLRVMRAGSEVILTVLEVFKYDPLHSWTASELKIQRAQPPTKQEKKDAKEKDKDSEPQTKQLDPKEIRDAFVGIDYSATLAEEAADRALSAVRRKLDKTLSVEFTVNELIAEATDPANLGNMYIGWGPQY